MNPFQQWPGAKAMPWAFIPLDAQQEPQFLDWFRKYAAQARLDPNPDDPRHQYNYRAWWRALQAFPDKYGAVIDQGDQRLHAPSTFKAFDHPNRYVYEGGNLIDSILGEILLGAARK